LSDSLSDSLSDPTASVGRMGNVIDYRSPGIFTDLRAVDPDALRGLATDPVDLCRPVSRLVIQLHDAEAAGIAAERLTENQFLTGAEAWAQYRRGAVDGATFGVHGTENFGPSEIRGNAVRDLAA